MPLARIITRTPQDVFAVSEYLRSQGYSVETVSPGEFRVTPAELELNLGRRGPGKALEYAKALVESHRGGAPTQIEAPAAPEPAQPQKAKTAIAYDIVGRPVAFADEEEPERRQESSRTRRALASLLSRVTEPVRDFQQRRAERRARKLEAVTRRREQELARERARQEIERQRMEAAERHRREQIAVEQRAEQERALAAAWPFVARRRRASRVILRRAVVTAFGASLMLLLGFVAYVNRRPASPLSPGALMLNTSVKQEVPFGPVTIMPAAAAPKPSPVAAIPKPSPARPSARVPRRGPQPIASTAKLPHDSDTE